MVPDGLRVERMARDQMDVIDAMNREIFGEKRIINSFDKEDLMMLVALVGSEPVGFKLGYRQNRQTFYSAKGGVRVRWRRQGIARFLMEDMMARAREEGYRKFAFDTFPNMHPGMTMMALSSGFRLTEADFNRTYQDFRLRFEVPL